MMVFVDTSALYAVFDRDDRNDAQGMHAMLAAGQRTLSLTDCVSFEIMRRNGCTTAFVCDAHFEERGFTGFSPEVKRPPDVE